MLKKFAYIMLAFCLVGACSEQESSKAEAAIEETISGAQAVNFDALNANHKCNQNSAMVCALELALRCTVNPKMKVCNKKLMPKFIFMEDESLKRPTKLSYKLEKIKSTDENNAEVFTSMTCDAPWFGLCQGNVIYVMNFADKVWKVKEIYAMEAF